MGGNIKIQVQDSELEYFFLKILGFQKRISLSKKKTPLIGEKCGMPKMHFVLCETKQTCGHAY